MTERNNKRISTGTIARVGVLGAIAAVLFFFPEIPVIGFYKLDFSTLPALLGGFAMGPWAGLAIVLIKDLVGMLHSSSAMVGELADFVCSAIMVVCAAAVYKHDKTRSGALKGMLLGIVLMSLASVAMNYYVLIPFYIGQMHFPEEAIIGMMSAVVPAVDSLVKLVFMITLPFNLLKGAVLCLLTMLLYKRLSPLLHGKKA